MPWTPEDWEGLLDPSPQAAHPTAPNQALTDILLRIPGRDRMTAADLGCTSGGFLSVLAECFGTVVSVGRSEAGIAAARKVCREDNVRYRVGDFADLSPMARSIDVALALDLDPVMGVATLDGFVEQVHGVLVEGGIMVLSVPAAKRMGGPVELHLGRSTPRDRAPCVHEVELQYRVRRAGFQGLRIRRFEATDDGPGTLLCMAVRRAMN